MEDGTLWSPCQPFLHRLYRLHFVVFVFPTLPTNRRDEHELFICCFRWRTVDQRHLLADLWEKEVHRPYQGSYTDRVGIGYRFYDYRVGYGYKWRLVGCLNEYGVLHIPLNKLCCRYKAVSRQGNGEKSFKFLTIPFDPPVKVLTDMLCNLLL